MNAFNCGGCLLVHRPPRDSGAGLVGDLAIIPVNFFARTRHTLLASCIIVRRKAVRLALYFSRCCMT